LSGHYGHLLLHLVHQLLFLGRGKLLIARCVHFLNIGPSNPPKTHKIRPLIRLSRKFWHGWAWRSTCAARATRCSSFLLIEEKYGCSQQVADFYRPNSDSVPKPSAAFVKQIGQEPSDPPASSLKRNVSESGSSSCRNRRLYCVVPNLVLFCAELHNHK
jgi:hypothetical protein